MSKFFIFLFDWFEKHRGVFYASLGLLCVVFAFLALQVRLDEDISSFFGKDEKSSAVFDNIKAKDRIIVVASGSDPDIVIEASERFADTLSVLEDAGLLKSVTRGADFEAVHSSAEFIYDYLPVFLTDKDWKRLDTCLTDNAIHDAVSRTFDLLVSPSGMVMRDILLKDPLSIGTSFLKSFEKFGGDFPYEIYSGHIFTADLGSMLMFAEPSYGMGSTGNNARMVRYMESAAKDITKSTGVTITCIGGPVVAVHNASQIKWDTNVTLGIAMLVILIFIFASFRSRRTIPLLILPPVFGALSALAMIYLIQGSISAIAIGAGSVVLGIAFSYSIHMISHSNHVCDPRQIIHDLAYPLTIGSLTTIGAFTALIFTNSPLLKDMGLFSVFALVGTALFCLIYLPHFISRSDDMVERPLLGLIERINSVPYDKNRCIIALISVLTVIALFFYRDVTFDSNMTNINYIPDHIAEAEKLLSDKVGLLDDNVLVACAGHDIDLVCESYERIDSMLSGLKENGVLQEFVSVGDFVVPTDVQKERLARWNSFWDDRRQSVLSAVERSAVECGLRPGAFDGFADILWKKYEVCGYTAAEVGGVDVLSDWISSGDNGVLFLGRMNVKQEDKPEIYEMIENCGCASVIDRAYFSSKMVADTSEDFDFILLISSLLVFVTLLVSYGRVELAIMAFLPMCVSWVLILGIMAVFDIRFNIVNVILATFIFGIGDDFSIFIMDGLLQEYKNGKKTLASHKTAIFFSAFTTIVGIGALIFAKHPAIRSIAVISVLGLSVVVLVSYTVQPFLFRLFISGPVSKGGFPYTLGSILNSAYTFSFFLIGCIVAKVCGFLYFLMDRNRVVAKASYHRMLYRISRVFLKMIIGVKPVRSNPYGETFDKPAIIVANHQSFSDIMLLLSMHPKLIMLTNSWVWNSPFFGSVIRQADYYHTDDGYEAITENLRERMREGYSVVVFPEGTRSEDCSVRRFHKGAFYLADKLNADIIPVIIYGAGQVCTKKQSFYIKRGVLVAEVFERIPYGCGKFGSSYQEQARKFRAFFKEEYRRVEERYGITVNPYFRYALISNYIYKGPVLEWYMRIKSRIDGYYDLWDRMVPRKAVVTDVGCGYGQLSFMLAMRSADREVHGIDYDEDKVLTADRSCLSCGNVTFHADNMVTCRMPQSDVFIFNDSLHYVDEENQRLVLEHCLDCLNPGGMLIVRDGDSAQVEGQKHIDHIEVWSTKILGFNRTSGSLVFVSGEWMADFAKEHGLDLRVRKCDDNTSEMLYIMTKEVKHEGTV